MDGYVLAGPRPSPLSLPKQGLSLRYRHDSTPFRAILARKAPFQSNKGRLAAPSGRPLPYSPITPVSAPHSAWSAAMATHGHRVPAIQKYAPNRRRTPRRGGLGCAQCFVRAHRGAELWKTRLNGAERGGASPARGLSIMLTVPISGQTSTPLTPLAVPAPQRDWVWLLKLAGKPSKTILLCFWIVRWEKLGLT